MKILFEDKPASSLLAAALGVLAGFVVVFFCEVPDHELWAFYDWSAETFGFWMFSTSLLVLFSENRRCAALHAGVYIFPMFFITTVYKSLCLFWDGGTHASSLAELTASHLSGWLQYSIPAALVCAVLGAILWSGRANTRWGNLLKILPAVFLLTETAFLFGAVFLRQTKLFSALTNLACLVAYLRIYCTSMRAADG